MSDRELELKILEFKKKLSFIPYIVIKFLPKRWSALGNIPYCVIKFVPKNTEALSRYLFFIKKADEFITASMSSSRRVSTFTYLIIALFFILKGLFHSYVLAGEYEEYLKLRFVTRISGYEYFAPWAGSGGDFFGHPGLMNLMFYKWSHWFGLNLESARMFCLSLSTMMIAFFYSLAKRKISHEVAFFSTMSLLALPLFQVESILFLFEIGSYTLALMGLYFYYRNYLLFYSLFSIMAFLYLESAIAFPLAVFIYEALTQNKRWKQNIFRPLILLSPFVAAAAFFVIKSHFDPGGGHFTEDLVVRRLLNPILILQEVDFKELWMARWATLEETLPVLFLLGFLFVVNRAYKKKITVKGMDYLFVIGIAALIQFIFGSFFSEKMGGSDFYAGFFLIFLIFFSILEKWKFFRVISLGFLTLIIIHSVSVMYRPLYGWTQTHLDEYSRYKDVERIKANIEKVPGGPFKCHIPDFDYHPMFCSDFFRMKAKNIISVKELNNSDIFIFSDSKEYELDRVRDYGISLNRSIHLGRLHEVDLYMYFAVKK